MIRYASVCSGVEAASLAWEPLGWKPVWFSEIEPFPCAVLRERFPTVPNLGDMTKISVETLQNGDQRFSNADGIDVVVRGGVDLLVGGTPCQGFSVAGGRGGLQDDRSILCLTFCELLGAIRPRWFVWENVPGVLSTAGGEDFKAFLRKVNEVGYSCAWRVLDAQYVRVDGFPRAVPQRRRRVFVVGHIGGWEYPFQVLFEPCGLLGASPPSRTKSKDFTGYTQSSTGKTGSQRGDCELTGNRYGAADYPTFWDGGDVSSTVTESFADDRMPDKGKLPCIIEPTGQKGPVTRTGSTACYAAGGYGEYVASEVAATIAGDHDSRVTSDNAALIHECWAIAENVIGRQVHTGGNGPGFLKEVSYTQNATGVMGVCSTGGEEYRSHATVRRLLPVECERLMGFPDNWTKIPWRGKPVEACPDGPRYKACGNSMCVNVMRWVGARIQKVEDRYND